MIIGSPCLNCSCLLDRSSTRSPLRVLSRSGVGTLESDLDGGVCCGGWFCLCGVPSVLTISGSFLSGPRWPRSSRLGSAGRWKDSSLPPLGRSTSRLCGSLISLPPPSRLGLGWRLSCGPGLSGNLSPPPGRPLISTWGRESLTKSLRSRSVTRPCCGCWACGLSGSWCCGCGLPGCCCTITLVFWIAFGLMTRSVAALTGMFSSLLGVLARIGSLTNCCCGACCGLGGSLEGCRLSGGGIGPGLWGKFATRRPLSAAFEVSWICGVVAVLLASFLELSSISPSSFSASTFVGSIKGPLESRLALHLA